MGKDNQPKHRQADKLARKIAQRESFERVLIVTEGSKTEPNYFNEIKRYYRLPSANVRTIPSVFGTDPLNVVNYAKHLAINGNEHLEISPGSFEQVYAVFDRDEHQTYHQALSKAESLDQQLQNDLGKPITFKSVASVPDFELWLLLHYDNIMHPIHRDEVMQQLKRKNRLQGYEKGQKDIFDMTQSLLETAKLNAQALAERTTRHDDAGPYTDIHILVDVLINLRKI